MPRSETKLELAAVLDGIRSKSTTATAFHLVERPNGSYGAVSVVVVIRLWAVQKLANG